jgi:hypothetical protein
MEMKIGSFHVSAETIQDPKGYYVDDAPPFWVNYHRVDRCY